MYVMLLAKPMALFTVESNSPHQWAQIFNNDAIVTSAILDRLLENSDTIVIQGPSYRMRDQQQAAAIIEENS